MTSEGKDVRVISGVKSRETIVCKGRTDINSTADFANKKFASPQLGNTQDWLRSY